MHLKPGISFRVEKMSGNYIKENGKSYAWTAKTRKGKK